MAVLRPPMIYGKGCRGNYQSLRCLILKTPMFPRCGNERSMLYVGNLRRFMGRLLESGQGGLYFPQNREYVSTDGTGPGDRQSQRRKSSGSRKASGDCCGPLAGEAVCSARYSAA